MSKKKKYPDDYDEFDQLDSQETQYESRHAGPERKNIRRRNVYTDNLEIPPAQSAEDDPRFPGYGDIDEDMDNEPQLSPKEQKKALKRERRKKRLHKFKVAMIIIFIVALLAAAGITFAGYKVTQGDKIFPGVTVGGVRVGNMTTEQALAAVADSGWDGETQIALKVRLLDKATFKIDRLKAGAMVTKEDAVALAYAYGHGENIYDNLLKYLNSFIKTTDVCAENQNTDSAYIRSQCKMGIARLNDKLGDGSYKIDKKASVMRLTKGAGDLDFDVDEMVKTVEAALLRGEKELIYTQLATEPQMPDFNVIHATLAIEPKDAYFSNDNTFTIIPDVEGCDFSIDEAESAWKAAAPGQEIAVKLQISYPEITQETLQKLLFRDKLGSRTTYYKQSTAERIGNVNLAASKVNGIILYPGQVFSYNETLGQRTEENGYMLAGAYSDGETVQELGGGICQVSSTLYCAMLYSYGVNTVQRVPHYFQPDYIEPGCDATVSWPKPDFKFRNDTEYPIKITAYCDNEEKSVTVEIWGTNLEGTYIELSVSSAEYYNGKYPDIMEGYGYQVVRNVFDQSGVQIDTVSELYNSYHTHEATDEIKRRDEQAKANEALEPTN